MAKGEFVKRIEELRKRVGGGKLIGKVVVDQIYAQNQHENLGFNHTGGGPKFLTKSMMDEIRPTLQQLAQQTLQGDLPSTMARGMERVAKGVQKNAPHEFNDLRNSAHPSVKDRGRITYNRSPVVKRLTKTQLKAKDRARGKKTT